MDVDAIAGAIATRFAAAQVTPPAGYANVRSSTADLPNQIAATPAVLVFADSGTFSTGNGTRTGLATFVVRFYFAPTIDGTREQAALRAWATVLVDQLRGAVQLGGLAGVARATVDAWRLGILRYGTVDYAGIELGLSVATTEAWAATA